MSFGARNEVRENARRTRRAPSEPMRLTSDFELGFDLEAIMPNGPVELSLLATNEEGEVAAWLDDCFWSYVIGRWGDRFVTIAILPTPTALLHPIVRHQMDMLRRVVPGWRLIGFADIGDLASNEDVLAVARSPYHEVRFKQRDARIDRSEPTGTATLPLEEVFGRIRREQSRLGATTPILVRLPSDVSAPKLDGASSPQPQVWKQGRMAGPVEDPVDGSASGAASGG